MPALNQTHGLPLRTQIFTVASAVTVSILEIAIFDAKALTHDFSHGVHDKRH